MDKFFPKRLLFFLLFLGSLSMTMGQHADTRLKNMLNILPTQSEDSSKVDLLCEIGYAYYLSNDLEKGLFYIDQAIHLAHKIQDYKGLGIAYNMKGITFRNLNNNTEMLKYFMEAKKNYQKANHTKGISETLANMGGVYLDINQPDTALFFLNESYKFKIAANDSLGMAMTIIGQAMCYGQLNNYRKEADYYTKAEEILGRIGERNMLATLYLNMSNMYSRNKDFAKAKTYCMLCREGAERLEPNVLLAKAITCKIHAEIDLGQLDSAKNDIEELLPLLKEMNSLSVLKDAYGTLGHYYGKTENYKNAYLYSQLQEKYADSLYLQEKKKEKEQLATVFKLKEKEKEAEILLLDQKQKEIIIFQQQISGLIVILGLVVILMLFVSQFRANKRLKKARDLLERQKTEISEQKKELELINATKDQIFSIISHDLMSPVIALNGILELIKDGMISPEDMPEFIDEAMIEVSNTTTFLRNLLLWAKSQMDGFIVSKETFNIEETVITNIELLTPQLRKKHINIQNSVKENKLIVADKDLLNTVLRNLIANAIKFTGNGGTINIFAVETESMLEIAVQDSGVGIPKTVQDKILGMEMYSTRGTENEKGTGLGLALCKKFVEKNGGDIWLESQEGIGSTFYFTVPKLN